MLGRKCIESRSKPCSGSVSGLGMQGGPGSGPRPSVLCDDASESFGQDYYLRSIPMPRYKGHKAALSLSPCSSGRSPESRTTLEANMCSDLRKSINQSPVHKSRKKFCSQRTLPAYDSSGKRLFPNANKTLDEISETGSTDKLDFRSPRRLSRRSNEKPPRSNASGKFCVSTSSADYYKEEEEEEQDQGHGHGHNAMMLAAIGSRRRRPTRDDKFILETPLPEVGQILLKMTRSLHQSGENPYRARYYALKAVEFFENCTDEDVTVELVTSLHLLAATCCKLGQYEEAVPILKRSLSIFNLSVKSEHALAIFAGYMELGDTYTMLGQYENALKSYGAGLGVQKQVMGDMDVHVAETCRYVAESHLQAMQFSEAEELCAQALKIHTEHNANGTLQESWDRRLMALILAGKGDHIGALENLVKAGASLVAIGRDADVACVDCSIGDSYTALGRYEDAISAYHRALPVFRMANGESHTSVASVYASLADLYLKTGKFKEARNHCENALLIYGQQGDQSNEEIATGLTEISGLFVSMGEHKQALSMLQRALEIMDDVPGQQMAVAGIEAQIGVLFYLTGKHEEAYMILKKAVSKLRLGSQKRTWLLGVLLNQMGLACVGLNAIWDAAENFEEAKLIMDQACGPHHLDTLHITSNLAAAYDAMGRLDDAITLLEGILEVKEDRLGTVHPDVEEERQRLTELWKETGKSKSRKPSTLQDLIFLSSKTGSTLQANSTTPVKIEVSSK